MNSEQQTDQPIDVLLRSFFQRERPSPWPGSPVIERAGNFMMRRSRVALVAALVALWVGQSWLMKSTQSSSGLVERESRGRLEATHRSHGAPTPSVTP